MFEAPKCQHIKGNGSQCGSPALKDNLFCYYHQHCRPVTFDYSRCRSDYSSSDITLPVFDDAHSIQITLHRVTELVLRHQIDQKDASLVLYALQLAMCNLKRLESSLPKPEQVVTEPPIEPLSEIDAAEQARQQAVHARFVPALPGHFKAKTNSNDDDLPSGTIHASIDTAPGRVFALHLLPTFARLGRARRPGAKSFKLVARGSELMATKIPTQAKPAGGPLKPGVGLSGVDRPQPLKSRALRRGLSFLPSCTRLGRGKAPSPHIRLTNHRLECACEVGVAQMTPEVSKLLEKALSLSVEEQEALADSLIANLGEKMEPGVAAAWDAEIKRRIEELDSGEVKTVPWEEVRQRNLDKLSRAD